MFKLFKKTPGKFVQVLIIIFCFLASGFFIRETVTVAADTFDFVKEIREYKAKKEELQLEHDQLVEEVRKLQDPNYIGNLVRAKYNITKEGEAIFHLPSAESGN